MNHADTLSMFACCFSFVSLTACAIPLPKPPLLIPMPTPEFLLTPPEKTPPKAHPSP